MLLVIDESRDFDSWQSLMTLSEHLQKFYLEPCHDSSGLHDSLSTNWFTCLRQLGTINQNTRK